MTAETLSIVDVGKAYRVGSGWKQVLRGVNFEIGKGERAAVLGRNGAGKSTLMRIVGGIEHATSGWVERNMSLSWPLGLYGGFQGSLTGVDNIKFISRVYDKQYADVYDFVQEFAELGDAIREPVKTYSSGMRARLAFGLSLAIDFDCYLIDEVIFVGDRRFHRKCQFELFERDANRAMLMISHDMNIIRQYCNKVVVLHNGVAKVFEDVETGIDVYNIIQDID